MALLNEHRNLYQPATLWEQIEKAAIEQSFSPSSAAQDRGAPPEAHRAEVACIYAFEFSRSQNEFSDFYRQFFAYMQERPHLLESQLSLTAIANASIAFASFGMTTPEDAQTVWDRVRKGTCTQLVESGEPLTSTQPIEMILGTLSVVDANLETEK